MYFYKTIITKESEYIYGYILKRSSGAVLIAHIEDMYLDGYMRLRKDHIASIRFNKVDVFQSFLLEQEGINQKISLPFEMRGNSLLSVLKKLPSRQICSFTVAGTKGIDTIFGQCIGLTDTVCRMREVLADGKHRKTASRVPLNLICGLHRGSAYHIALTRYIPLKSDNDIKDFFSDNEGSFYDYE